MSLIVHSPGMLATVQDMGRDGTGSLGVSRSGAGDSLSLRVGNRLVGNPDHAAAIELTLVGGSFEFTRATPIVIAGAKCDASLQHRDGTRTPISMWSPTATLPGDVLHIRAIGGAGEGCRAYLCVMGGIETAPVLGSRSTQVGAMLSGGEWAGGVGGLATNLGAPVGMPLRCGDVLAFGTRGARATTRLITAALRARCQEAIARRVLRVTRGPQWDTLSNPEAGTHGDLFAPRRVLDRFNRRGVRLTPGVGLAQGVNALPTQPTDVGFIQAPGPDELIILGPDGPPTGGYPVVGCVASVDLAALGQLRPHDTVRFEVIDVPRARQLLSELHDDVDREVPPIEGAREAAR